MQDGFHGKRYAGGGNLLAQPGSLIIAGDPRRIVLFISVETLLTGGYVQLGNSPTDGVRMFAESGVTNITLTWSGNGEIVQQPAFWISPNAACISFASVWEDCDDPCECLD